MRTIDSHSSLEIDVLDDPGSGGANHHYLISGMDLSKNACLINLAAEPGQTVIDFGFGIAKEYTRVLFQNGPIAEVGVNGVTHEALLAIIADRLTSFQSGPFANSFNQDALFHVNRAQEALQARTRERMARNVEGTHKL